MVTTFPDGRCEFKLFAPHARLVEVLGTFTGWHDRPAQMNGAGDGWWTISLHVPPGDHDFQYRIDGWAWQADYAAHGVRMDSQGSWISRLAVPRQGAPARQAA